MQRQENIVKAREREQKLKEMREAYEAKKARLTAWAAPQTATPDATLQEMKDQIFKLSQVDFSATLLTAASADSGNECLSAYFTHVYLSHARAARFSL